MAFSTKTLAFHSNIWKIYAYQFLKGLHFFGAILVPFFTEWGKLSYEQIFFLQAWFMFWIFVMEVPTGTFADRFGRKFSLVIGSFLMGVAALTYISTPQFEIFLLAEFIWALSSAFVSGAEEAILYDSLKETGETHTSKKIFSQKESIQLFAIAIGGAIGGLVVKPFGITFPYLLTAVSVFLSAALALTLREPTIHSKEKKPAFFTILKDGIGYLRTHKILQILAIDMIGIATIAYFMIWMFQPLLESAKIGVEYFGFVLSGIVVVEIGMLALYPKLETMLGNKKRLLFYTSIGTGVFFILSGITDLLPLLLISILLGGGIGLTRKPLLTSYMQKYIPSDKRATVSSAINMLRTLSITLANLVVGKLAQWNIHHTMVILGAVAIGLALLSKVEEEHLID